MSRDWVKWVWKGLLLTTGSSLLFCSLNAAFFGYTEPYRMARMSFPETGVIVELPVQEGQEVKKGDILARLDYRVLKTELNIAEEQLRIRKLRFEKIEELHKQGHISFEEYERSKADLYIDTERAKRIEAQIESRTLRAPFDSIVIEIKQELSESVSSASTHVLTVVQLDRLQVDIHMPPEQANEFEPGESASLVLDGYAHVQAAVDFVSPVIDAASNTVRVKFSIENPERKYRSGVRSRLETEVEAASVRRTHERSAKTEIVKVEESFPLQEGVDPLPQKRRRSHSISHENLEIPSLNQ